MQIVASVDTKAITALAESVVKAAPKSIKRAQTEAYKKGVTALSKEARKVFSIKAADFKQNVKVKDEGIAAESRLFTTVHFPFTPRNYSTKRRTATLTVKKQKKKMPHAFIANPDAINGGNTMLWERTGKTSKKGRESIAPIRSVSIAQIVGNEEVYKPAMDVIEKTFVDRLEHHLERGIK